MTGGLLQIVSYGSQDLFLTGNPEITFFKVVYRRHTNFSLESFNINFDSPTGFGKTSDITIKRVGDLLFNTYVVINIPEINIGRTLDQTYIDNLTDKYNKSLANYEIIKTFLGVNMTAYRNAYNIYVSENITYSYEMIDEITNAFVNYDGTSLNNLLMDDYYKEIDDIIKNGGVTFRYSNITGTLNGNTITSYGNISLVNVQDYWSDSSESPNNVDKKITFNIMNFLINNCTLLDKKYFDIMIQSKKELEDAYKENYKFAWVDKLGHAILDYVEFYIGGNKIDKHTGLWLDIWNELMGKKSQEDTYNKMIGNLSILTSYDRSIKPSYTMKIPLRFFFNKFSGTALPLIALQYNDVSFHVKFKKFSECSYIENYSNSSVSLDDILENMNLDMTATMMVEYVFLDSEERRKFAQVGHEYLIHQTQYVTEENLSCKSYQLDLYFEHPCLGIIWVIQRTNFLSNPDGHTKCYWTKYTTDDNDINPITNSQLSINNNVRIEKYGSSYFNYLQPLNHCKNTPSDGINSYWFSMFPFEHQPSGSCNMSRLTKVKLSLDIDPFYYDNEEDFTLSVFTINYNVLRIIGGSGNVAYTT